MRIVFLKVIFTFSLIFFWGISYSQSTVYKLKTVVIDAGHGGKDPGAVGKVAKEKDITLAIALKTGKYIQEKVPGVKVIYTRSTDEFIELHKRAEIANKNNANLFISIHVNASTNTAAYGTDSWIMGLHKSKANLEVAKLENKVIMVEDNYSTKYQGMSADSTEAIIIHTMMQSANLEQSAFLGSLIQNQFRNNVGRKDRGVHSAPFMVLWRTSMPSILIETGFLSNPEEEQFLITQEGQDLMASAIYRAFKEYKTNIETKTNIGYTNAPVEETPTQQVKPTEPLKQIEPTVPIKKPITQQTQTLAKEQPKNETNPKDSLQKPLSQTELIDKFANQLQNDTLPKIEVKPITHTQQTVQTVKPIVEPIAKEQPKINNSGIIYSIQLASSKTKIDPTPANFKGFENVHIIQEDGWYKYSIFTSNTYKEIVAYHQKVKVKYPESFLVARKNGVKIPIQEAKLITQ